MPFLSRTTHRATRTRTQQTLYMYRYICTVVYNTSAPRHCLHQSTRSGEDLYLAFKPVKVGPPHRLPMYAVRLGVIVVLPLVTKLLVPIRDWPNKLLNYQQLRNVLVVGPSWLLKHDSLAGNQSRRVVRTRGLSDIPLPGETLPACHPAVWRPT
jgi:hypothetical protein